MRPRQLHEPEVRKHYEFLRDWLIRFGYDLGSLIMPEITVLVIRDQDFANLVRTYANSYPQPFELSQLEEYGRVRSVEEVANGAVGWCFGPYGKSGRYLILMREEYTPPHLGAEILHVFEGQIGLRRGTLEKRFKDFWEKPGSSFGPNR